jgi:hypothetical protein
MTQSRPAERKYANCAQAVASVIRLQVRPSRGLPRVPSGPRRQSTRRNSCYTLGSFTASALVPRHNLANSGCFGMGLYQKIGFKPYLTEIALGSVALMLLVHRRSISTTE